MTYFNFSNTEICIIITSHNLLLKLKYVGRTLALIGISIHVYVCGELLPEWGPSLNPMGGAWF